MMECIIISYAAARSAAPLLTGLSCGRAGQRRGCASSFVFVLIGPERKEKNNNKTIATRAGVV